MTPKRRGHAETKAFHDPQCGTAFTYPDFVPSFTGELFDHRQWAEVVFTRKADALYCIWPVSPESHEIL